MAFCIWNPLYKLGPLLSRCYFSIPNSFLHPFHSLHSGPVPSKTSSSLPPSSTPPPSSLQVPSVSHGVLAKFVAELLDEQSQFAGSLRLLLQELVAEAGNVLLDLLQLTYNGGAHTDTNTHTQSVTPGQPAHQWWGLSTWGGSHLRWLRRSLCPLGPSGRSV